MPWKFGEEENTEYSEVAWVHFMSYSHGSCRTYSHGRWGTRWFIYRLAENPTNLGLLFNSNLPLQAWLQFPKDGTGQAVLIAFFFLCKCGACFTCVCARVHTHTHTHAHTHRVFVSLTNQYFAVTDLVPGESLIDGLTWLFGYLSPCFVLSPIIF